MDRNLEKSVLCLLLIVLIFAGTGCMGRGVGKNDTGSTTTATPTPVPAATPASSPTVQPGNAGNYTTDPGIDDVWSSDGDAEYEFPEDLLPTPPAE